MQNMLYEHLEYVCMYLRISLKGVCICFIGVVLQLGVKRMVKVFLHLWAWSQDKAGDMSAGGGGGDGAHPVTIQL